MSNLLRLIESLSLGLTLAIAVAIGCGFLAGGAYELYDDALDDRLRDQYTDESERFRVLADGRPVIEVRHYRPRREDDFFDLSRQPIELPDEPIWLEAASLRAEPRSGGINHRGPRARIIPVTRGLRGSEDWYFVFDDKPQRHRYLVGCDFRSRRRLGYLGPHGFQGDLPATAQQFAVNGAALARDPDSTLVGFGRHVFLHATDNLYRVDLASRTVQVQPGVSAARSIGAITKLNFSDADRQPNREYLVALRTNSQILVLNPAGKQRQQFVIPDELHSRSLNFYVLPDGDALLVSSDGNRREAGIAYVEFDTDLYWITPGGKITKQVTFTRRARRGVSHVSHRIESCIMTVAIPSPLASATMSLALIPNFDDHRFQNTPYGTAVAETARDTWPALLSVCVLAAGLAYLTDRRQRKYGLPRSYAWIAFVLLLGLPGYIAYRTHRPWPIRHPPAPPERTGIEVLA